MTDVPLLLDTHVFLWWRLASRRVKSVEAAVGAAPRVFVSLASAWECAIKVSLGRLELPGSFEEGVLDSGFEPLSIEFRHLDALAALPWHHRDPFDRMLIAQALADGLTLVTADAGLVRYGAPLLRV